MKRPTTFIAGMVLLFLATLTAAGATPRRGWIKVHLTHADGNPGPFPPGLLQRFGGELLVVNDSDAFGYLPAGAVAALRTEAGKSGIAVARRDDFDVVRLPSSANLDTRQGIGDEVPQEDRFRHYPPNQPGLFVLQFIAPPRNEWVQELTSMGWDLSRYIPTNAYIAVGRPEIVGRTKQLRYVQFVDFFHPYQKLRILVPTEASQDVVIELPARTDVTAAIETITALADDSLEIYRGNEDTRVSSRLTRGEAESLLRHPLVISVSPRPIGQLSGERQVMSLTSNLNTSGSAPTSPTGYLTWLSQRCPTCSSMSASSWRVGLADLGLDNGSNTGGHPDLAGRKSFGARIYENGTINCTPETATPVLCRHDICSLGNYDCDKSTHGTIVAGIMVGNAATGRTDGGGFYWGMGVAPWAGVFSTKVGTNAPGTYAAKINLNRILEFTADAANNGVTIQNHSFNQYTTSGFQSGLYSTVSRDYDIAVRDADGSASTARPQLLIAVSAGNNTQGGDSDPNRNRVLPGGTAKNVLSMGGAENNRPEVTGCFADGSDFRNIMSSSRNGTLITGYVKPDLVAPAGPVASTNSSEMTAANGYCIDNLPEFDPAEGGDLKYNGDSGTSFAAPVGAAAALIVKRYLGATPSATTPALAKAMLVAGAKSIRGGVDRSTDPDGSIGPLPNGQQGFGRISFDDIITGSTPPIWYDQSANRTFHATAGTRPFRIRLRVRDASKPVKVALVWTDPPGTVSANAAPVLVNDLDLEVYRSSSQTHRYVGNYLHVPGANGEESIAVPLLDTETGRDRANNVEVVRAFLNANEEFDVQVNGYLLGGDISGDSTYEQDFALVALNADAVNGGSPIAPIATANRDAGNPQTIVVSWTAAVNIMNARYEVWRGATLATMVKVQDVTGLGWTDAGRPLNTTYVYRVVAVGDGGVSVQSNNTIGTTIAWIDETLTINNTLIKAVHWTDLRRGVDYVRTAAGLSTGTWGTPIVVDGAITASQRSEIQSKLVEALDELIITAPSFGSPTPNATLIRPEDVAVIRGAIE